MISHKISNSALFYMIFQNIIELERQKYARRPRPPDIRVPSIEQAALPSPFQHDDWIDLGPYYELKIHVRMLQSIDISIDTDKRKLLLNAVIDNKIFATPAKDVKTTISIPDDDNVDLTNLITHVNDEDISLKLYKTHYEQRLPLLPPKKRYLCILQ